MWGGEKGEMPRELDAGQGTRADAPSRANALTPTPPVCTSFTRRCYKAEQRRENEHPMKQVSVSLPHLRQQSLCALGFAHVYLARRKLDTANQLLRPTSSKVQAMLLRSSFITFVSMRSIRDLFVPAAALQIGPTRPLGLSQKPRFPPCPRLAIVLVERVVR